MRYQTIPKDAWVLLTDGTNTFDSEVRAGAMQAAKEASFTRIRLVSEDELETTYLRSKFLKSGKVGLLSHVRIPGVHKAIGKYHIPAILLGEESVTEWRKAVCGAITVCSVDNRAIGQMAADYFCEHNRFVSFLFVDSGTNPAADWWVKPRYDAFADTLEEHGAKGPLQRISMMQRTPDEDEKQFLMRIKSLPKPIAVFCCNDRIARDIINFCDSARLRVPEDVAVLGVDNETEICESSSIGISSIKVEYTRLGRTAFKMLLHQLKGEPTRDKVILCPPIRVIERSSTKPSVANDIYVARALAFISTAPIVTLDVTSIVSASGASRSYLAKHFRQETGRTILESVHDRIMKDVKRELLETDKTIAQIAEEMGFASSGLCAIFHRLNGISMSEYRASKRV